MEETIDCERLTTERSLEGPNWDSGRRRAPGRRDLHSPESLVQNPNNRDKPRDPVSKL